MKELKILISLTLLALAGCEKSECGMTVEGELNKVFRCGWEEGTKTILMPGNSVYWAEGDTITYFRCKHSDDSYASGRKDYAVKAAEAGAVVRLPVDYTSGEDYVIAYTKGGNVGAVTAYTTTTLAVTNGINPSQDGSFSKNMISKGQGELDGEDDIRFGAHLQSFIKFSLTTNSVLSGTFSKIVIKEIDGTANIAGDVTYHLDGTTSPDVAAGSSGSETITISPVLAEGTDYYVAIKPATYAKGLRLDFLDEDGTSLQCVETAKEITVPVGTILDLGSLNLHKFILGNVTKIYPECASVVWKDGLRMTKKIWVSYEPNDMTGLDWVASDKTVVDIEVLADETYDGKNCKVALVTPKKDGKVTITATPKGGGVAGVCKLIVGDFIDMGCTRDGKHICWARSNVKGSCDTSDEQGDGKIKLEARHDDCTAWYMWGGLHAYAEKDVNDVADYNMWGGSWSGTGSAQYGGRYNSDGLTQLKDEDDLGWHYGAGCCMPTMTDFNNLTATANTTSSITFSDIGIALQTYTSKILGYTDMSVYFGYSGVKGSTNEGVENGLMYKKGVAGQYYSSTLATANGSVGNSSYSAKQAGLRLFFGGSSPMGNPKRWGACTVRIIRLENYSF